MTKSRRLLLDPRQFVELYFMPSAILWAFCRMNRRFQFQKTSQHIISANNETLSVIAVVRVCNPDCLPAPIGTELAVRGTILHNSRSTQCNPCEQYVARPRLCPGTRPSCFPERVRDARRYIRRRGSHGDSCGQNPRHFLSRQNGMRKHRPIAKSELLSCVEIVGGKLETRRTKTPVYSIRRKRTSKRKKRTRLIQK